MYCSISEISVRDMITNNKLNKCTTVKFAQICSQTHYYSKRSMMAS